MPKTTQKILSERLCERDLENLQASGLSDQTILENELRTVTDRVELATILNRLPERPRKEIPWFCEGGALVFPYCDLQGTVNCFARARPHKPRVEDGKERKYESPLGSELHAYLPRASLARLRDGKSPVYVTEGEKKAMALSQLGLAAVGIAGIWCGCVPRADSDNSNNSAGMKTKAKAHSGNSNNSPGGKRRTKAKAYSGNSNNSAGPEVIPDLAAIPWAGRVVYIVFDWDPKEETRQDTKAAAKRLTMALRAAGAKKVYVIDLPPGPDGAKQGVDDFLAAAAAAAAAAGGDAAAAAAFAELRLAAALATTAVEPSPTLGETAYHGLVGEFVKAVAPYTEATEPAILAHLLCAAASYIGRGVYLCHSNLKFPAILNAVLVGPTSRGRKGTALVFVERLMEQADPGYWPARYMAGGLSSGEGLIKKLANRWKKDKASGKAECVEVEKRLFDVEEEFSRILVQTTRDGSTLSQTMRQAFDGKTLENVTKTNPLRAENPHACIVGHITQEEASARLSDVDMADGFGNRYLWFAVRSDKYLPNAPPVPAGPFANLAPVVKRVGNCCRGAIILDDEAIRLWEANYYDLADDKPGLVGKMLARGEAFCLRLALVYYLLDPHPGPKVRPEHLRAALAVWRYSEACVRLLFGWRDATLADGLSALARKVLELLKGEEMTKDQLNDHLSAAQKTKLGQTLEELLGADLVAEEKKPRKGPGRPAVVYRLA
jgi:hypothetical protein